MSSRPTAGEAIRVLIVIGTRPEAIKLGPVAAAMVVDRRFDQLVVATGQHGSVVAEALGALGVTADVTLECERTGDSLAELHVRLISALDPLVARVRPDVVVVEGDTSSALVAAQIGFWHQADVAHVEAGLRSGDMSAPFPEEGNRRLIGSLANVHLAPTTLAAANLAGEGIPTERVYVTGNTVIDALHHIVPGSAGLDPVTSRVVVVTAHRRESWGRPMARIAGAVAELAEAFSSYQFVVAAHMNPAIQAIWSPAAELSNVQLSGPVDYPGFVRLLASAKLAITDSGGIQEEAPTFGVPVLVTRDTTERPEGISAGVARLVGTDRAVVIREATQLLSDDLAFGAMSRAVNPYGDGDAARRTLEAILHSRGAAPRPDNFLPSTATPLPARRSPFLND